MKVVGQDIVDEVLGHQQVIETPVVGVCELAHAFSAREAEFVAVGSGEVGLVAFREDGFWYEDGEDAVESRQVGRAEEVG